MSHSSDDVDVYDDPTEKVTESSRLGSVQESVLNDVGSSTAQDLIESAIVYRTRWKGDWAAMDENVALSINTNDYNEVIEKVRSGFIDFMSSHDGYELIKKWFEPYVASARNKHSKINVRTLRKIDNEAFEALVEYWADVCKFTFEESTENLLTSNDSDFMIMFSFNPEFIEPELDHRFMDMKYKFIDVHDGVCAFYDPTTNEWEYAGVSSCRL